MSIERRNFPQFFITAPAPCPYLPGRLERKVFTHLVGPDARNLNTQLSHGGFRRSQNIAYRPACEGCQSCVSVRVAVDKFKPSDNMRRISKRNAELEALEVHSKATSEHYALFRDYIDARHGSGGMADMSVLDFAAMVDESLVNSHLTEYRLRASGELESELVGCVLVDTLEDGLSLIYSFYDPNLNHRSLGTYIVLDQIEQARRKGLAYVYLGYWVKGSEKMAYKARFLPQERLTPNGWRLVTE